MCCGKVFHLKVHSNDFQDLNTSVIIFMVVIDVCKSRKTRINLHNKELMKKTHQVRLCDIDFYPARDFTV